MFWFSSSWKSSRSRRARINNERHVFAHSHTHEFILDAARESKQQTKRQHVAFVYFVAKKKQKIRTGSNDVDCLMYYLVN